MICKQRLYLTADKAKVVPEGHKDAATLYASPGDEIPESAAERFGLKDGGLPEKAAKPPADKVGKTPANKGGKAPANKAAAAPAAAAGTADAIAGQTDGQSAAEGSGADE